MLLFSQFVFCSVAQQGRTHAEGVLFKASATENASIFSTGVCCLLVNILLFSTVCCTRRKKETFVNGNYIDYSYNLIGNVYILHQEWTKKSINYVYKKRILILILFSWSERSDRKVQTADFICLLVVLRCRS